MRFFSVLVISLASFLSIADAWDSGGHEIIATIAWQRLNPKARQAVDALAREAGPSYDAITVACWMDDLKSDNAPAPYRGLFKAWHFIDLGLEPGDPQPSFEPGDDNETRGNVVQGLKRALVVLQGGSDPYVKSQAIALAMVMHLVGDIHQPLHAATKYFRTPDGMLRHDAGGNKELVVNAPADNPQFNLHYFWDSAWRASFDGASGLVMIDRRYNETFPHDASIIRPLAEELAKMTPPRDAVLETSIDQWARESNALARDFVYRRLTATQSPKYCRLSSEYVSAANTIARRQLVLAAWRLAELLNDTLGSKAPVKPPPSYPAGPPDSPEGF
ncbi:MAG TPA: S1/P1 nuclease [Candidatus Methylacidiphilales bacterium]|nr:S1/P1 nuclease [Candidatus Methylacidiphilales bacterium]